MHSPGSSTARTLATFLVSKTLAKLGAAAAFLGKFVKEPALEDLGTAPATVEGEPTSDGNPAGTECCYSFPKRCFVGEGVPILEAKLHAQQGPSAR